MNQIRNSNRDWIFQYNLSQAHLAAVFFPSAPGMYRFPLFSDANDGFFSVYLYSKFVKIYFINFENLQI